jgi:hypothetical protein
MSPRRTASFFAPDVAPGNAAASKIGSSEEAPRSHAFRPARPVAVLQTAKRTGVRLVCGDGHILNEFSL